MPDFRRGIAAIQESESSSKGGDFRPWVPQIKWDDGDEKYVLFFNFEEAPTVALHEWIPVGEGEKADGTKFKRYEWFIDRTDPGIGEDEDPLTEKGSSPKERTVAVAVELEPIMTTVRGRPRPKGFEVKTVEFDRKIRDDEGKATDETESVTAPVIGIVTQAPSNFFGYLASFNETDGPVDETPFKVKRRGGDKNTAYDFSHFMDQEVDLTNLIEFVDGITYLNDEMDDLSEAIEDLDAVEAASLIAAALLNARLEELSDPERYEELTGHIEEVESKYGKKKGKGDDKAKSSRPKRSSQRTKAKSNGAKAEDETPEESAEEESSGDSDEEDERMKKFNELKAKARKKKESKGK